MIVSVLQLFAAIIIAFLTGVVISKLKLPSHFGLVTCRNDSGAACSFPNQ